MLKEEGGHQPQFARLAKPANQSAASIGCRQCGSWKGAGSVPATTGRPGRDGDVASSRAGDTLHHLCVPTCTLLRALSIWEGHESRVQQGR